MIQKTIIATLLALLGGTPFLRSQSIDTLSIGDSPLNEVIKEIKKETKEQGEIIYRMPEDSMMVLSRDTFRMVKRKRKAKTTIEETRQYWGFNYVEANGTDKITTPTGTGTTTNYLPELNNAKSIHFGLEQQWGYNLYRGKIRFFTGIRYDINNYRFQNSNTILTSDNQQFQATVINGPLVDPVPTEKSKLVTNYIGVPISLGIQDRAGDHSKFNLKVGVHAGYLVRAHTKIKQSNGNSEKQFDDFNINNFYLAPFVNLGYGDLGLYMRYPLTNVFKDGQGAESQCLQFGITLKMS